MNYYRKFLPNLAIILQPLNDLLQKDKKWTWSAECTQAVNTAKELLTTSNLLTHYDPVKPIKLAANASQYRQGAIISHVFPNGEERPIAFASRSLSKSEKNYSQIDKEALGLVYGVQKFHMYLYGRRFTLVTDQLHQAPLGLVQSLLPLIRRLPLLVVIRLASINRLHDLVILRLGEGEVQ